jgi:hypothetical protein
MLQEVEGERKAKEEARKTRDADIEVVIKTYERHHQDTIKKPNDDVMLPLMKGVTEMNGKTPRHLSFCHVKVAQLFLEKGACLEARDKNGGPPLIFAAANDLLDKGADVHLRTCKRSTVMALVRHSKEKDAFARILEKDDKMKLSVCVVVGWGWRMKNGGSLCCLFLFLFLLFNTSFG